MAFWGIELKPGTPYVHRSDDDRGRLHISQATLGSGSSAKKSIVQCKVGDKDPIYLCSLLPEKLETCALNHEFDEDEEVTFSIVGPHSVHLSGFFYGEDEGHDCMEHDDGSSDSYSSGEDMMGVDSDDDSMSYDSDDEDEDDGFDMYPPSPVPNSGVKIEEIVDDEKPTNENGLAKRTKKKKTQSSISDDNENSKRQLVVKAGTGGPVFESEDEDGFPISAREKKSDISKTETKLEETAEDKKLKRKSDAVDQDEKPARETTSANEFKQKKNKKKKVVDKVESAQENGISIADGSEETSVPEIENNLKPSEKKKDKKKKKQNKQQENVPTPNAEVTDKKGSAFEKQEKEEAKSMQVRTYANGLVVEELAMGRPNGKKASPGKKVSVRYIGKLKKNGKIFDSNIGSAPFKFRLGIGQVIKGWDVGVNGMRVGDKRRLTIPPAMGYGAEGARPAIPPNAWLVFDVELVEVN